jgi:hypothetical protein
VFTAWYALIPYIKQLRFVFKGLKCSISHNPEPLPFTFYFYNTFPYYAFEYRSDISGTVHHLRIKTRDVLENGCLDLQHWWAALSKWPIRGLRWWRMSKHQVLFIIVYQHWIHQSWTHFNTHLIPKVTVFHLYSLYVSVFRIQVAHPRLTILDI